MRLTTQALVLFGASLAIGGCATAPQQFLQKQALRIMQPCKALGDDLANTTFSDNPNDYKPYTPKEQVSIDALTMELGAITTRQKQQCFDVGVAALVVGARLINHFNSQCKNNLTSLADYGHTGEIVKKIADQQVEKVAKSCPKAE